MGTHEETREFIDRVKRYQNPYPKPFAKVHIPNQAVGAWRVQRYVVTEQDVMIDNLRSAMDGKAHRIIPPGAYTRLGTVGCPPGFVMSDTPAEAHEHMEVIHATRQAIHRLTNGHGVRVLINGLGIGMVLQALLTYEQVEYIRVIEVQPEVIQMVAPRYRQPRVDIVEADALEYKPDKGEKFDVVWHDIWPEALNDDTWDQCKALHRKYGKIAEWQGSWSRAYYEQERRREYRGYGW